MCILSHRSTGAVQAWAFFSTKALVPSTHVHSFPPKQRCRPRMRILFHQSTGAVHTCAFFSTKAQVPSTHVWRRQHDPAPFPAHACMTLSLHRYAHMCAAQLTPPGLLFMQRMPGLEHAHMHCHEHGYACRTKCVHGCPCMAMHAGSPAGPSARQQGSARGAGCRS